MAGHSKWNNIKQRKGAQDAKKGKIFQRHSKEIYQAAKEAGTDPEMNPALRLAIDRAKASNMPNDNINRAIAKAEGGGEGANFQEATYEGYGPNGVAVLVQALTDNRNRTSSTIKAAFNKHGGNLGSSGSVSFIFETKGYIAIDRQTTDVDEETMLMTVLEAGADDLISSPEAFEIFTSREDFAGVRDYLMDQGYELASAEITMEPTTRVSLSDSEHEQLDKIIDALSDDDDIQDVYHNAEETQN